MGDSHKVGQLRARIKEMEQLIGQKQIQLEFKDKMIEIAEQAYKIDIKKKFGLKLSSGSGWSEKNTVGE